MAAQVAPFVALMGGIAGLGTAAEQWTMRARLRGLEAWAARAIVSEQGEQRVAALRLVQRAATARLIAANYVPNHHYVTTFGFAAAAFGLVASSAVRDPSWQSGAQASLGSVSLGVFFVRQGIRIYLERQRIANAYFAGEQIEPARLGIMDKMEGGVRREFTLALFISIELTAVSWGATLLLVHQPSFLAVAMTVIGLVLANGTIEDLRDRSVTAVFRDNNSVLRRRNDSAS